MICSTEYKSTVLFLNSFNFSYLLVIMRKNFVIITNNANPQRKIIRAIVIVISSNYNYQINSQKSKQA